jgi:cytochrome P450
MDKPQDNVVQVPDYIPADRVIDFDIANDPALNFDAFKKIEWLRDQSLKVAFTPHNGGHYMVFGKDLIQQVLSDGQTFSTIIIGGLLPNTRELRLQMRNSPPTFRPLSMDAPSHTPWRLLLLKYFGPAQIRSLEPFIRAWCERMIAKLDNRTSCDFVTDFAGPIPVSVFMEQMGLPLDRFEEFRGLVLAALTPPGVGEDHSKRMETNAKIQEILSNLIAERRVHPKNDLVSGLLSDRIEGREITHAEMMSMCYLLFLAGLDTVTNAMTYGMRHLAQDAELQAKISADRSLIPGVVEKLLRLYTFVNTYRLAMKDTELDGVQIKAGDMVWCILWSGSNDPAGESEGPRHMAFGGGDHICLGMHLARLELRVMYETWFEHVARFSLVPDDRPYMRGGNVMNIVRLPLSLEMKNRVA